MGSSGSGMFGTYHGDGEGALPGGYIGSDNQCPILLENINLEDVAISDYYNKYNNIPSVGSDIKVYNQLVNRRLVVMLSNTNEVLGNIPVRYNYLNLCIKKGINYSGIIISSGLSPIPYIVVNLYAK